MKGISSSNENVSKLIETTFRYNKMSQKNEKRNNITSDYFIVKKTHKLSSSNAEKNQNHV